MLLSYSLSNPSSIVSCSFLQPTPVTTSPGSHQYYPDQTNGVCKKDCAVEDGKPCGGSPFEHSAIYKFYDTLEDCCALAVSYVPKDKCVSDSKGEHYQGSRKFRVNWEEEKCTRDCPVDSHDPECGGLVEESAETTYHTVEECCSRLSWVGDCRKRSVILNDEGDTKDGDTKDGDTKEVPATGCDRSTGMTMSNVAEGMAVSLDKTTACPEESKDACCYELTLRWGSDADVIHMIGVDSGRVIGVQGLTPDGNICAGAVVKGQPGKPTWEYSLMCSNPATKKYVESAHGKFTVDYPRHHA